MVKIVDHIQTGKRKFIRGPGRKKDVKLSTFEIKNEYDNMADAILFNKDLNNPVSVKKEIKKKKIVKITDKIRKLVVEKHLIKVRSGKSVKGLFKMYNRYGKFNRRTLEDFLQKRLNGQKEFEYYG
tara:strand:- start:9 stop:386 length:378 start_codon:yes stop_codon:yes gene_type:complete